MDFVILLGQQKSAMFIVNKKVVRNFTTKYLFFSLSPCASPSPYFLTKINLQHIIIMFLTLRCILDNDLLQPSSKTSLVSSIKYLLKHSFNFDILITFDGMKHLPWCMNPKFIFVLLVQYHAILYYIVMVNWLCQEKMKKIEAKQMVFQTLICMWQPESNWVIPVLRSPQPSPFPVTLVTSNYDLQSTSKS